MPAVDASRLLHDRGRETELSPFEYSGEAWMPGRLWEPNPLLATLVEKAAPGQAIDLACGTGRDAIYLASAGWQVIAVDCLVDALERGKLSASRLLGAEADRIEWRCIDVGDFAIPTADLITMFFFFERPTLKHAAEALKPGGTLLLETFTPTHRAAKGKPKNLERVLSSEEAVTLLAGLRDVLVEEAWHGDRHTIRVSARA